MLWRAFWRSRAQAAGRDPASIDIAFVVLWPANWTAQSTQEGTRRMLSGGSEDIAADILALARAGVRHLCVTLQTPQLSATPIQPNTTFKLTMK